jgi:hypothetical protein
MYVCTMQGCSSLDCSICTAYTITAVHRPVKYPESDHFETKINREKDTASENNNPIGGHKSLYLSRIACSYVFSLTYRIVS